MRFIFFGAFIFLMSLSALHAQSGNIEDRKEIMMVLAEQAMAWNEGNIPEYMNGYWRSDSLVFVGSKGVTKGWEKTLENYQSSYPNKAAMGTLKFDIVDLYPIADNTYFMIGKWHLTRLQGNLNGHFTLVWKLINGKWKIVSDHSS
ncbi:YybH family protein [Marinigracilibium pacificum]|uniref:Nuclear transport factor 2 family protein n=1 Tax=Marinigracilibium pacificum TaxID=2729599 RepID=A0A848J0K3_9BACT|nr:nuclear transport factor 2 family protein [Marinigracilibium pacificum]NMM49356.1 nuclear transport factor 2 family protein [Marinigracilibium pacificum]